MSFSGNTVQSQETTQRLLVIHDLHGHLSWGIGTDVVYEDTSSR